MDLFISYRREDTSGYALGVRRELNSKLPEAKLFLDVESIDAGVRWRDAINDHLKRCDLMLVIIGDEWLERRDGIRKLDDRNDTVRVEIAAALAREIHIIPVLVEDSRMPPPAALPDEVRGLCEFHALSIHDRTYDRDLETLVTAVSTLLDDRERFGRSTGALTTEKLMSASPGSGATVRGSYPSRITERWLEEKVPTMGREELIELISELKDRGWDEKSIYDYALSYSSLRPPRKLPSKILPQWLALNVPLMSIAQTRKVMDELRHRRWSDVEIEEHVLRHHPRAPSDEIPPRIHASWLQQNTMLMTTDQQQRLAGVLRKRGWDEAEVRRYLPLAS